MIINSYLRQNQDKQCKIYSIASFIINRITLYKLQNILRLNKSVLTFFAKLIAKGRSASIIGDRGPQHP